MRVVIVGGGIGGLTLALMLHERGIACDVYEAAPALRRPPGVSRVVSVDEVLEALRTLDRQANVDAPRALWARRQVRRRSFQKFRAGCTREDDDRGPGLSG